MLITNATTATHTHTPGPWHTQGRYIVPADNGPSIGSAVAQVNARLMAAAPDMLHLLYTVLPIVEDACEDPCYKPGYVSGIERQIRTLIDNLERPL